MTQLIQEQHIVSLPPHQEGFGAAADGRPELDQWIKKLLGAYLYSDSAYRFVFPSIQRKKGSDDIYMWRQIVMTRVQVCNLWTPVTERGGQ
jgi:hypothetical protein